jgi:hypothetical protein
MSAHDLAEFQRAAVEAIYKRLTDPKGSRRFLLADEVGLGKTIVARAVLDKLLAERATKRLGVVYLCSNAEIADQNREKLAPAGATTLRRVTQLVWRQSGRARLELHSFTPGTSLSEGTGLAWERRLLLYLVHRALRIDIGTRKWREYFRCSAAEKAWHKATRMAALKQEFGGRLRGDLVTRLARAWKQPVRAGSELSYAEHLRDEIDRFDPNSAKSRKLRTRFIGTLRSVLQRVLLQQLNPALVILDEVQRFRDVIEQGAKRASLAGCLFENSPAVLILSATPYRMLALDHESQDHYSEFLDTVRFLFADRGNSEVEQLKADLQAFRERLELGAFMQAHDPALLKLRMRIENRLRKVICRTERNAYIRDGDKGVHERRPRSEQGLIPRGEELGDYIRLRRFLLDKVDTAQHITEYWKSCPAPFTFMDSKYAPMAKARKKKARVPSGVIERSSALGRLADRNLRFRELFHGLFGESSRRWRFLWTRPTYLYYRDDFFGDDDPRKMLVFSGWRFVPKAIALLTSLEAEHRISRRDLWRGKDRPPLRFSQKGSFHVFDVCLPSPALAHLVDPASLAHERLNSADLLKRTKHALRKALSSAGVEVGSRGSSPIWRIVARLEKHEGALPHALRTSDAYAGRQATDRFVEHADRFMRWMSEGGKLRISGARFDDLAKVAAFSPAVCMLRALRATYPELGSRIPEALIDTCFGALRAYFNRRIVRAVIRSTVRKKTSYARAVLEYCARGHFQAVVDEYVHLGKTVLQRGTPSAMAEHLGRVLGVGMGSPAISRTSLSGRIDPKQEARRSHFALAFGDDVGGDEETAEQSGSANGRKTAVREAFNSPFWPFVLSTTSVGQEGLDFHLFCRDIVHWNLPSNPVDLEQREGRLNRRDGLAIRRAISRDWPIERIGASPSAAAHSFWGRVFQAVESAPDSQRYKHGLYPHWIFESAQGRLQGINRHLLFYPDSQDEQRYQSLKERLALYRLVFGQPRQQDLLDQIQAAIRDKGTGGTGHLAVTRYMVNLSPLGAEHAHVRAEAEATEILSSPEQVRQLVADVEALQAERAEELAGVLPSIDVLKRAALAHVTTPGDRPTAGLTAVRALIYLRDPYDAVADEFRGLGLEDDVAVISAAAARVIAMSPIQISRVIASRLEEAT